MAVKKISSRVCRHLGDGTLAAVDNSRWRLLGDWKAVEKYPMAASHQPKAPKEIWKNQGFPEGIVFGYDESKLTFTTPTSEDELAYSNFDRLVEPANRKRLKDLRHAAEVHRLVRRKAQANFNMGDSLENLVNIIEQEVSRLAGPRSAESGQAFPTGVSYGHIAAHYSVSPLITSPIFTDKEKTLAVDFGVHFNGNLIDSAWTFCSDENYDPLLSASKEAVNASEKLLRPGVRLSEIGERTSEIVSSYEMINPNTGKMETIKPIISLCGHTIGKYSIHDGLSIPMYNNGDHTILPNEQQCALEVFCSIGGVGRIKEEGLSSHFMLKPNYKQKLDKTSAEHKKFIEYILKRSSTMAFSTKWMYEDSDCKEPEYNKKQMLLNDLCRLGVVQTYPPLAERRGAVCAQFEHSYYLSEYGTECLSKGDDY